MPFTHEVESAFQIAQLGVESTWGTGVAATVALGSVSITPALKKVSNRFTPRGVLLPTVVATGREHTELSFEGQATFTEIAQTFAGRLIDDVVSDAQADPRSYTVEVGGLQVPGCVVTGWNLKGNRDEITVGGTLLGKKAVVQAKTGGLTPATQNPIPAGVVTITIGGTVFSKAFEWSLEVANLWAMAFFIGSTQPANALQTAIDGTFSFKVEADAAGLAPVAYTGTKTCVIAATSGGSSFSATFDAVFEEPDAMSDEDGIYAIGYKAALVNKATKAIDIACVAA